MLLTWYPMSMDQDALARLKSLEEKTDTILRSVQKTQRYFQATLWITILLFVVPLIFALVAIPAALNSYLGSFELDGAGASQLDDLQSPQLEELMRGLL